MEDKKIVVIFSGLNYCYMKNEEGTYSFPSFKTENIDDIEREIRREYHIDQSFHRDWIDIRFWKSCSGRFGKMNVILDCYIVDISKSLFVPNELEYVDKKDVFQKKFSEEQSKIKELYRVIPSFELLDNDKLLGQIYWEDDQIKVSLTSSNLLDNEIRNVEEGYFPLYFCEFTGDEIVYCPIKDELIDGRVYFYSVEIYDPHQHNDMSIGNYIETERRNDVVAALKGDMFFSSSPVLTARGKQIIVSENIKKSDSDNYDSLLEKWKRLISNSKNVIRNNHDIVNKLSSVYSAKTPSKVIVQVFNVGQANCCYCDLQYRKLFFDIGVTYTDEINEDNIQTAINEHIKNLDADDVFISHWDMDHILGIVYNQKCLYGKTWIAPDIGIIYKNKPNLSLIRLTNYLITVGKSELNFIDTRDNNKTRHISNEITLFLGDPKSKTYTYKYKNETKTHTINAINNGGILMSIKLNKSNILFTGDCDNNAIPSDATKVEYDYEVVPHHGSIMNDPIIKAKTGKITKVFICIGNITGKFVEDENIDEKYIKNQGFSEVLRTRDLNTNCFYEVVLR